MAKLDIIHERLSSMTRKQRAVAQYILDNPDEASYLSLKEFSREVKTSEVSVLRFCETLGFDGYNGLKEALREYTQNAFRAVDTVCPTMHPDYRKGYDTIDKLRMVIADERNNLIATLNTLDIDRLIYCAQQLLRSERVFIFGHDRSFLFADYLCYRLNFLRIQATAVQLGEGNTVSTTLAGIQQGDTVILLSFPPYHEPTSNVVNYCHYKGVPVIAVTDNPESPAARDTGCVFICRTGARWFYNSQVSTLSFINVLASCIAMEMGKEFDEILDNEQDVMEFLQGDGAADKPQE